MRDRRKRNYIIGILSLMLVFLGVGYAALSSTLNINSSSNVTGNWEVKLISVSKKSVTGGAISNSTSINSDGLGASVSNTFNAPGDTVTYEVEVKNNGSIDAVINIDLPEDDDYYLFSTTFVDDTSLKSNSVYKFEITIEYNEDASVIPTGTSIHEFSISAIQDGVSESAAQNATVVQSTGNYIGYYADVNNDNVPDGIIFADLLKSANDDDETVNGQWTDDDGNYSYSTIESSKEYNIIGSNYNGDFGKRPLIGLKKGSTGNDRFYVMALNDIDDISHYWYFNASGYENTTSESFGQGRANTYTMINKWNNEEYGAKKIMVSFPDMWGSVQNLEKYPVTTNGTIGWFVPSRAEWSCFAESLGISAENYSDYNLNDYYWSSSETEEESYAWFIYFYETYMQSDNFTEDRYVRLATTF